MLIPRNISEDGIATVLVMCQQRHEERASKDLQDS